jgi:hypothetical protein
MIKASVHVGEKTVTKTTPIALSGSASIPIQMDADVSFTVEISQSGQQQVGPQNKPKYIYNSGETAFNRAPREVINPQTER